MNVLNLTPTERNDVARDAYGFALAELRDDNGMLATLTLDYELTDRQMVLVVELLSLMKLDRDRDEFYDRLYELALSGAGDPGTRSPHRDDLA